MVSVVDHRARARPQAHLVLVGLSTEACNRLRSDSEGNTNMARVQYLGLGVGGWGLGVGGWGLGVEG